MQKVQILDSDIENLQKDFEIIKSTINFNSLLDELNSIKKMIEQEKDFSSISNLMMRKSELEKKLEKFENVRRLIEDAQALYELWKVENQQDALLELNDLLPKVRKELQKLKIDLMLSEKYDKMNAILEITPGAGGTESMDWAGMLMRMYIRWATSSGFDVQIIDKMPGEQAGIKSATLLIQGEYAYGYLKGESGIHRLVRISPFDANRRRHTSFAAVTVYPEIDETIQVNIDPKDLIIETFRASGPGGQHVNKTDSAVRIKHIPTGIVVVCQNERSQHKNKQIALRILQSRLYELERRKKEKEKESLVEKKDIAWGNQIRSYILHPYKLVKDHRTGYETTQADRVLDGEIDDFIEEYLKFLIRSKQS
ncbi:MAG: peptide chain release factor 2 [Candidatus Calescibacterium sp.]|jgi:peptide chain release factor 2|nr:peptide chain release factor 2 [Candidatus Calescibacterium sp.]